MCGVGKAGFAECERKCSHLTIRSSETAGRNTGGLRNNDNNLNQNDKKYEKSDFILRDDDDDGDDERPR